MPRSVEVDIESDYIGLCVMITVISHCETELLDVVKFDIYQYQLFPYSQYLPKYNINTSE